MEVLGKSVIGSLGGLIVVVIRKEAVGQKNLGLIPSRNETQLFFRDQTYCGAHPTCYVMGSTVIFLEGKAGNITSSSSGDKNKWSNTSITPHTHRHTYIQGDTKERELLKCLF